MNHFGGPNFNKGTVTMTKIEKLKPVKEAKISLQIRVAASMKPKIEKWAEHEGMSQSDLGAWAFALLFDALENGKAIRGK